MLHNVCHPNQRGWQIARTEPTPERVRLDILRRNSLCPRSRHIERLFDTLICLICQVYLYDMLLQAVLQRERTVVRFKLRARKDAMLIKVTGSIVDSSRAEDADLAYHDGFIEHACPPNWVEVVRAKFVTLPSPSVGEGSRTHSALKGGWRMGCRVGGLLPLYFGMRTEP